jgi:hypothetical protein
VRGECETDAPSAKKRSEEERDETKIGGENSNGSGGLTCETEIGGERRDEVCRDLLTQTFNTPEPSTVSELWANAKTLIEETSSDLERKQKRSILHAMGGHQRIMKALMEHAVYSIS